IPAYQTNNVPTDYTPDRNKKLLLTKKEISRLVGVEKEKGLTIVPISMYNKGRKLKMAIAIVRGKKKYDKRETLKKKDSERDVARTLKNRE
ncbi:MAG: SsrA-binding protein, partial [Patescibacteria group bacterium]